MKISKVTKSFLILSLLFVGLLFLRLYHTDFYFGFGLMWNLFLAWIPLFFALVARRLKESRYTSLFLWVIGYYFSRMLLTSSLIWCICIILTTNFGGTIRSEFSCRLLQDF